MRKTTDRFGKHSLSTGCLPFAVLFLLCCNQKPGPEQEKPKKTADYIRQIPGVNDSIPASVVERGKVLISYSDCYTCHKEERKAVGPAFTDIAKRYPANKVYIEMLAQKVIVGGSGSWGYPVMEPHPQLSVDDAKMMVSYILSLEQ